MNNLPAWSGVQPTPQFPTVTVSDTSISKNTSEEDSIYFSCKSRTYLLFDQLEVEVNMLFKYPFWLPIERCQISSYSEKLRSSAEAFQFFTIKGNPFSYMLLIDKKLSENASRIYYYKNVMRTTVGFQNRNDPPDLNCVGVQLALEVAVIYEASMQLFWKTEECVSQDFTSYFYFDRRKFQEQLDEEVFVGFQEEASNLLKKLACITKKQLEATLIVGMAGLGKTTLARRLYNDPYLVSYFYVRVWVCCSQDYQKRDLLPGILRSVVEITDEVCRMNDNMLAHVLYRALMGQRYLIVIDNMWSCRAWDDLKRCFPDNNKGSKIILTTRLNDVALHAQSDGSPLCLRFLTDERSFDCYEGKLS